MSELVTVTLKMMAELRDRLKARAAADGTSVSALLIEGVSAPSGDGQRLAELEAEVKRLRALSVDRSIQAVGPKRAVNQIGRHAAGPILEPTLNVRGTAKPFFRPGTTGEKAKKSGR